MRAQWLLPLLLVSLPASASRFDKFESTPKEVTISGTVEIPLVESPWGDPYDCVWVNFGGDDNYLFRLETGIDISVMSEELAEELGLKKKTGNTKLIKWKGKEENGRIGGPFTYVDADTVVLGGLVLDGVRFVTAEPEEKAERKKTDLFDEVHEGFGNGGTLSLTALHQLGWAVLPSEGVVRFVPADAAKDLVQSLGGDILSYESREWSIQRMGKGKKSRFPYPAISMLVPAKIGGMESPRTVLELDGWSGWVDQRIAPPGAAIDQVGDARYADTSVVFGSQPEVPGNFYLEPISTFFQGYVEDQFTAIVASEVLSQFDMAVDPVNHTVALRHTATSKRADPVPNMLAYLKKKTEPPVAKEGEDETKKSGEPDEEWKPSNKDLGHLAALYNRMGDLPAEIATYKRITELKPRNCDGWENLGEAHLNAGYLPEALAAFQQASTLYHAWWGLPVEERTKLQAKLEKMEEDEREAAEQYAQPADCFTADGWVASTSLALGHGDEVARIYKERLDLDETVSDAWGASGLAKGNLTQAQEGYRQSLRLTHNRKSGSAQLGIAIVYAESGDWTSAKSHFDHLVRDHGFDDVDVLALWLYYTRKFEGDAAAMAAIEAAVVESPRHGAVLLAWMREAIRQGADAKVKEAQARLDRVEALHVGLWPRDWTTWSQRARYLVTLGDIAGAEQAAAQAFTMAPDADDTWQAKVEVALVQGDQAGARAALTKQIALQPEHPVSALERRALEEGKIPEWLIPVTTTATPK
jgi:tetratricopeptide (TPR) repeat protein